MGTVKPLKTPLKKHAATTPFALAVRRELIEESKIIPRMSDRVTVLIQVVLTPPVMANTLIVRQVGGPTVQIVTVLLNVPATVLVLTILVKVMLVFPVR